MQVSEKKDGLYAAFSQRSILPPEGWLVQLQGQAEMRLADRNNRDSDIFASVIVLESIQNGKRADVSVWVSLDLCRGTNFAALRIVRKLAARGFTEIPREKIMISATHTHSAPYAHTFDKPYDALGFPYYLTAGPRADRTYPNLMSPEEYICNEHKTIPNWDGILGLIADAIIEAWKKREKVSYGSATVQLPFGNPRFSLYWEEQKNMVECKGFPGFANYEDPNYRNVLNHSSDWDVQAIGFWNAQKQLVAVAAGIHAPAQINGSSPHISADFWKEVRAVLPGKLGIEGTVPLLNWCLTAGDLGPCNPFCKESSDYTFAQAGEMISGSIAQALQKAEQHQHSNPALRCEIATTQLKIRHISPDQYQEARSWIKYYTIKYRNFCDFDTDGEYGLNAFLFPNKTEVDTDIVEKFPIELEDGTLQLRDPNQPYEWWDPFKIRTARATVELYELQASHNQQATKQTVCHTIVLGDTAIGSFPAELYAPHGWMLKSWVNARTVIPIQIAEFWEDHTFVYLNNPEAEDTAAYGNSPDMCILKKGEGVSMTKAAAVQLNHMLTESEKDYSRLVILSGGITGYYLAPEGYTELLGEKKNLDHPVHPGTNDTLGCIYGVGTVRQYNWGGFAEFFHAPEGKRPLIYAFAQRDGWFQEQGEKSYERLVQRMGTDRKGVIPQQIVIDQGWNGDTDIEPTKKLLDLIRTTYPQAKVYVMNGLAVAASAPRQEHQKYPYNAWHHWKDAEDMRWVERMKDVALADAYCAQLAELVASYPENVYLLDVSEQSGLKDSTGHLDEAYTAMNGWGMQLNVDGIKLLGDFIIKNI